LVCCWVCWGWCGVWGCCGVWVGVWCGCVLWVGVWGCCCGCCVFGWWGWGWLGLGVGGLVGWVLFFGFVVF
ncbi:hypothetical protein RA275_27665, partial [Pseudomonas syringae pv. tagetis]